ncbi:MAG: DUF2520 domain-containing protein [Alphaproteobacteria bacterium]|nr:DUF2520 domain-containing protein [Alphaproteobacteria bacterium]
MSDSPPRPTIGLLGQGRLGRTLARLLPERGHPVRIWRRGLPFPEVDVAWILVSDAGVAEVARALPVGPVVLHASGALGLDVLAPHLRAGSLHPLQSFPGPEVAIPPTQGVPAAIAGHPEARAVALQLARDLGFRPVDVPGDRRLYHAAAVMAGNFATALLDAASELLSAAGVPPEDAPAVLAPLALASIRQAAERGCAPALTGPFARGDAATVRGHLDAIEGAAPGLADLYRALGDRALSLLVERGMSSSDRAALRAAMAPGLTPDTAPMAPQAPLLPPDPPS